MDGSSSGKDIANAMSSILRSLGEAGYEVRRMVPTDTVPESDNCFDELITDVQIRQVSEELFRNGHYARAVEEAFKCLNNVVKDKSGKASVDGAGLMRTALSANPPILKLNSLQTRSEQDEQRGYMDIFAGSMTGIRNPRAHEHSLVDDLENALELLVLANHLMRKLNGATK